MSCHPRPFLLLHALLSCPYSVLRPAFLGYVLKVRTRTHTHTAHTLWKMGTGAVLGGKGSGGANDVKIFTIERNASCHTAAYMKKVPE